MARILDQNKNGDISELIHEAATATPCCRDVKPVSLQVRDKVIKIRAYESYTAEAAHGSRKKCVQLPSILSTQKGVNVNDELHLHKDSSIESQNNQKGPQFFKEPSENKQGDAASSQMIA